VQGAARETRRVCDKFATPAAIFKEHARLVLKKNHGLRGFTDIGRDLGRQAAPCTDPKKRYG
jgi:hypothetical protein